MCLLCFYPNHIAYTALLSSEILFVFLVALSAFAFEAARGRAGFLMLSGMFWGLAALTKPQALILPFLFLFVLFKKRAFVCEVECLGVLHGIDNGVAMADP